MDKNNLKNKNSRGVILLNVLIFSVIAISVVTFFISWVSSSVRVAKMSLYKEQAFQIAEAGIDYYRWHLAHSPNDFQDGTGEEGPYTHTFYDKNDNAIGSFILTITPPITGSTIVTIKSEGRVDEYPSIKRTIQAKLAIPSFAKFAIVADDVMRFGEGTEVFGPIHSNKGIRFDGIAHNLVTSLVSSYNDPDHTGNNEFGVHTHINASTGDVVDSFRSLEAPPNSVQNRNDVFIAGREFPVPQADFTGITNDLSVIKTKAQEDGKYLAPSGSPWLGYHIVLKTNDTYDLYKVSNLYSHSDHDCQTSSWSIKTSNGQSFVGNFPNPNNGLIFVEDNVWVDGQVNSARLTIAAGMFPDNLDTRKSIIINKDLLYTNYDGTDVIGLIAQQDITVGMVSEDDLRIDGALMAVNGRVGRPYYSNQCSPYHLRSVITLYGMIGSSKRYGFAYTDNTGYNIRTIMYDANLLYGPPVSFPLTSDKYTTISWDEVE
ncbi:MAG TPA: hypothetical protein VK153_01135 [Candidatus Paceibacterota bacterium]|nr:hypothetical protein [Candidatus Paceibacterota bacterium]